MCNKNLTPNTLLQLDDELPSMVRQIGKTTYRGRVHFSTTSRESMIDKIKRILRNKVQMM